MKLINVSYVRGIGYFNCTLVTTHHSFPLFVYVSFILSEYFSIDQCGVWGIPIYRIRHDGQFNIGHEKHLLIII